MLFPPRIQICNCARVNRRAAERRSGAGAITSPPVRPAARGVRPPDALPMCVTANAPWDQGAGGRTVGRLQGNARGDQVGRHAGVSSHIPPVHAAGLKEARENAGNAACSMVHRTAPDELEDAEWPATSASGCGGVPRARTAATGPKTMRITRRPAGQ